MENQSIKDQVQELVKEREKECINRYVEKMEELKSVDYLINENKVRDKVPENHIMYKMKFEETTFLEKDGRKYEFLIEFDKKDYSYGIYYGCKCILDESKDILEQIKTCEYEWKDLREDVNNYLKLTFDIDFEKRENVSNNANDNTYWPFWYRLGDDEDTTVVAALAIKIISNAYKYVLIDGNKLEKEQNAEKTGTVRKLEIIPKYDAKSYKNIITDQRPDIDILLKKLEENEYLIKHPILEKCWMINKDKIEIGYFMYVMSIYLKHESILSKWEEDAVKCYCRTKTLEELNNKIICTKDKLIHDAVKFCVYEEDKELTEEEIKKRYDNLDLQKLALANLCAAINKKNEAKIKKEIEYMLKLNLKDEELKELKKDKSIDVTKLGIYSIDNLINLLYNYNEITIKKIEWKHLDSFLISHTGTPVNRNSHRHLEKKVDTEKIKDIMKLVIDVIQEKGQETKTDDLYMKLLEHLKKSRSV